MEHAPSPTNAETAAEKIATMHPDHQPIARSQSERRDGAQLAHGCARLAMHRARRACCTALRQALDMPV